MLTRTNSAQATTADPRWNAVLTRQSSADGSFVYAVKTTGVFCRPSCPSRPARPENVQFFSTAQAARDAGFRACKRCRPHQAHAPSLDAQRVEALCRYIENSRDTPTLEQLGRHIGLSPFHTQRLFKAATGVTPKAYAAAHRAKRIQGDLRASDSVTDAIYQAGYSSPARFYEKSTQLLGMTPTRYRTGGAHTEIRFAVGQCSLGAILVAATVQGVCAILLGDDPELLAQDLDRRFPNAQLVGGDAGFEQWVAQVVGLVENPQLGADLPLDIRGTAFQQRVWKALTLVPPGKTISYQQLAHAAGRPGSARAVAQACAANALAVAIPCHRVVRADGGLSGYRWGVERKRALLDRESRS